MNQLKQLGQMKKLVWFWAALLCVSLWNCSDDENPASEGQKEEVVISFEGELSASDTFYLASKGEADGYYQKTTFSDPQALVSFSHYFSDWGFGGGFTYTNGTDVTTPGYTNLSAIIGAGKNGSVYLTGNTNEYTPARITNLQPGKYRFKGAWVTNTTYDYLAIKDGNDGGSGLVTKFETGDSEKTGDWFKLTAIGHTSNETDTIHFYLADFRDGNSMILDTWQWFDWSELADADYITFEMSSSDTSDFGMNTPSYFCMDGITLQEN